MRPFFLLSLLVIVVVTGCTKSDTTLTPAENEKMKDAIKGKNAPPMTSEERRGMAASLRGVGPAAGVQAPPK